MINSQGEFLFMKNISNMREAYDALNKLYESNIPEDRFKDRPFPIHFDDLTVTYCTAKHPDTYYEQGWEDTEEMTVEYDVDFGAWAVQDALIGIMPEETWEKFLALNNNDEEETADYILANLEDILDSDPKLYDQVVAALEDDAREAWEEEFYYEYANDLEAAAADDAYDAYRDSFYD